MCRLVTLYDSLLFSKSESTGFSCPVSLNCFSFRRWDDWVPQDRLRKFTEENKELAQDLRQDLKRELEAQRQRAAPKSAVGRKKTAGSDFSSIRGSEERHSSVPVTGRGTKRGRDMDLDKVRYQFSTESFLLDIQQFSTPVTDVFGYDTSLDLDYYNTSPPPKRQKQAFSARYCFGLDGTGEEPPEVSNTEQTDPDGELPAAPGGRKTRRVRVKTTKARELEESSAGQWAEAAAKKPKPKPKPKRVATLKREASVEAKAAPAMKPKGQRRRPREPASHESGNAGPVAGPKEPAATTSTKAKAKQPSLGPPNDNPTTSQPEKDKAPLEIPPGYHGEVKFKVGRIDGSKQEEAFHSRPAVRLPIPDHLKALLVDDWENVTKNLSLVPLPSAHPVSEILTAYLEEEKLKRRPGSAEWDLVEEVVAGLKEYFDQTLGRILLYRFEREQYFQVRKKMEKGDVKFVDKTASDIYGAEHLCRLFGEFLDSSKTTLSL